MSIGFRRRLLLIGSFIFGFGIMGALDGILFHQILQWHSVVMDTDLQGRILSDGLFHTLVTIALITGGTMLWVAGKPTDVSKGVTLLVAGVLIGGGVFNLVEGIINHHLLQIHRVKPGDPNALMYDLAFLAVGALLLIVGLMLKKRERTRY